MNIAVGGVSLNDGEGIYSSVTFGFRAGKFSLSSGLSFMPMQVPNEYYYYDSNYGTTYSSEVKHEWSYPFGITFKLGFAF